MFFNELELLEIRLNELDAVVDRFVIVEGDRTLSGKPKALYFAENRDRFAPFLHKIRHVPLVGSVWPQDGDSWAREAYQRNQILLGLKECAPSDIVIISDADEIPSPSAIRAYDPNCGYRKCEQLNHYYYLNLRVSEKWAASVILTFEQLRHYRTPQEVRHLPTTTEVLLRRGGWHFSYLGGKERIRLKLESFAHQDLDRAEIKDLERIQGCMEQCRDLLDRPNHTFRVVPIDENYPEYVVKNQAKLKEFIRPIPAASVARKDGI